MTALFAAGGRPRLQSPIESSARELLTNFALGRFEAATVDFNDELRPVVTPALLAEIKAQLDRQAGSFVQINEAHERQQQGAVRAIELIARFSKCSVSVVVVFDLFDRIRSVYFNPILAPPVDPGLEAAARELLANFVAGRFEDTAKPFDPNMRAQLPPATLASLAANIAETFGTFQSVTAVHQTDDEKIYKIIDLTVSFTKGPVAFRVAFDAQHRVAALNIAPYKE